MGAKGALEEVGHQQSCEDEGDKSWSFLAAGTFYLLGLVSQQITLNVVGCHS